MQVREKIRCVVKSFSSVFDEESLFEILLIILSLASLFTLVKFGIYLGPNEIGLVIFFLTITATLSTDALLKISKKETFKKVRRIFFVKSLERSLFTWVLVWVALQFAIIATVREFPLVFSYGKDSLAVDGQIGGDNNLTFTAHSFPLNTTKFQLNEVLNLTNKDQDPHSFTIYLRNRESYDLSKFRILEISIKTNDGRVFLLYEINNGSITFDESVGFLIPSKTTWSVGMASEKSSFKTDNYTSLEFEIRLQLEGGAYATGMKIIVNFV